MVFAAYLMENTISGVFPGWGICTLFLSPIVGFLYERPAPPHRGAFTAFPVQNDKCPGGGQARLELADYVNQKLYFLIFQLQRHPTNTEQNSSSKVSPCCNYN